MKTAPGRYPLLASRLTSPWRSRAKSRRDVVLLARPVSAASSENVTASGESTMAVSNRAARSTAWVPVGVAEVVASVIGGLARGS